MSRSDNYEGFINDLGREVLNRNEIREQQKKEVSFLFLFLFLFFSPFCCVLIFFIQGRSLGNHPQKLAASPNFPPRPNQGTSFHSLL